MFLIFLLLSSTRFLPGPDCNKCVSEFAENGGCDCMNNVNCDVNTIIPEGCYSCGNEALEYCNSNAAGNCANIMIYC